jgi:CheY-like chemotaxis protein
MSPGKNILLVEGDPVSRANLAGAIGRLGHTVRCAASCAEALDELRSHRPHLIVLDLRTSRRDGGTFFKSYRRDPALANVPLVVLAAPGSAEEAADAPTDDTHLPNPIDPDRLLAALGRSTWRGETDGPPGGDGS